MERVSPTGEEEARADPAFPAGAGHKGAASETRNRARRGREEASTAPETRTLPRLSPSLLSFPRAVPRAHRSPHSSWDTLHYRPASFTHANFIWVHFYSSGKWEPGQSIPTHSIFLWLGSVGFYLAGTDVCRMCQDPLIRTSGLPGGNAPLPSSSAAPSGPEGGMLRGSLLPRGRLSSCPMG